METTKLTVRVPREALERAKAFAETNHTSLTRLVAQFLEALPDERVYVTQSPVVQRMVGILPSDVTIDEYRGYLEEKYGNGLSNAD